MVRFVSTSPRRLLAMMPAFGHAIYQGDEIIKLVIRGGLAGDSRLKPKDGWSWGL